MSDITHLLLRAADGDDEALGDVVRATQADVWRYCAHLVHPGAADDLAQETYLRAARSLGGFRGTGSGRAWLLTIARRACADHLADRRRRATREAVTDPAVLADVAADEGDGGPADDVPLEMADLIGSLPDDQREALVLTRVLGLTYAEAAEAAGVPVGTIRSRVARARGALAALLTTAASPEQWTDAGA